MSETVSIKTSDGVTLSADYYRVDFPVVAVAYFHMMPARKESWRDLAEYLTDRGVAGIAIDLRGHGASDGGPLGYKTFEPQDHRASISDVAAAVDFIRKETGLPAGKVILIGASIGANLSLKFLSENPEYRRAVLLSPGLSYAGIEARPLVAGLAAGRGVFFIASHGDFAGGSDNADQNTALSAAVPAGVDKQLKIYTGAGHGTDILRADPELKKEIFEFITG